MEFDRPARRHRSADTVLGPPLLLGDHIAWPEQIGRLIVAIVEHDFLHRDDVGLDIADT